MNSHPDTSTSLPAGEPPSVPLRRLLDRLPGLSPEILAALGEIARAVDYRDGALIMEEGELSDDLYLITSGGVDIFRASHGGRAEQQVAVLGEGEMLGEMALIDGAPRSLSARAKGDSRLLRICPGDLERLDDGKHLLTEFKAGLAAAVVGRMRGLTDRHVATLERQLEAAREQQQFGKFFLYTMTLMAIGLVTNNLLLTHRVDITPNSMEFAWIFAVILVLPSIGIVRMMHIPLQQLGLTTKGMRRSLIEGGAISLVAVLITVGLVKTGVLPGKEGNPLDPLPVLAYLFHSFLQELFGRGFFQSALQRFLDDRRGFRSVVFTSILFGLFHIHFGLPAVAVIGVGGLLFGAFYLRHHNLAGVTVLHFWIGVCFFNSGVL
ncbi:cyclic nucleotide-binding domain-containing protein [Endothiovibrio diazotrophicus]